MRLRSKCQKMKVVEPRKLNGAHMIFPKESGLAVRVYYPEDLKRFDEALLKERPSTVEDIHTMLEKWHGGSIALSQHEDMDGLAAFRKYFQYSFVICVFPTEGGKSYLDRPDSILHRIQRIMCCSLDGASSEAVSRIEFVYFLELDGGKCSSCQTLFVLPLTHPPTHLVSIFTGKNVSRRDRSRH